MPRGDGTGPWGLGPMTGRALGYCAGYPVPGYMQPGPGLGFGRGRGWFGWGRGYGRGYRRFWRRPWWGVVPYYPYAYARGYWAPRPWYAPFDYAAPVDEETALKEEAKALKDEIGVLENRLAEIEQTMKGLRNQGKNAKGDSDTGSEKAKDADDSENR